MFGAFPPHKTPGLASPPQVIRLPNKSWKDTERKAAKAFGGERNPLSGRSGKHTAADVIHPSLFIEVKHPKRIPAHTLWEKTKELAKAEGKVPVIVLKEKGKREEIVICRLADLKDIGKYIL